MVEVVIANYFAPEIEEVVFFALTLEQLICIAQINGSVDFAVSGWTGFLLEIEYFFIQFRIFLFVLLVEDSVGIHLIFCCNDILDVI